MARPMMLKMQTAYCFTVSRQSWNGGLEKLRAEGVFASISVDRCPERWPAAGGPRRFARAPRAAIAMTRYRLDHGSLRIISRDLVRLWTAFPSIRRTSRTATSGKDDDMFLYSTGPDENDWFFSARPERYREQPER